MSKGAANPAVTSSSFQLFSVSVFQLLPIHLFPLASNSRAWPKLPLAVNAIPPRLAACPAPRKPQRPRSGCADAANTICATSTSRSRSANSRWSPAHPARANPHSPSTHSTPKANAAMWKPSRRMSGSFSIAWTNPMLMRSRASRRPSRSNKKITRAQRARPSAPSPRSTTTSSCSSPARPPHTIHTAANSSRPTRPPAPPHGRCNISPIKQY